MVSDPNSILLVLVLHEYLYPYHQHADIGYRSPHHENNAVHFDTTDPSQDVNKSTYRHNKQCRHHKRDHDQK